MSVAACTRPPQQGIERVADDKASREGRSGRAADGRTNLDSHPVRCTVAATRYELTERNIMRRKRMSVTMPVLACSEGVLLTQAGCSISDVHRDRGFSSQPSRPGNRAG